MSDYTVYIYSIPNCKYCSELKDKLKDKNIEYTDIDVSKPEHEVEFAQVYDKTGTDAVPTILLNKHLLAPDVNFWSIDQGVDIIEKIINEKL